MHTGQHYFSKEKLKELLRKFEAEETMTRLGAKELKGFEKVFLNPGETKQVTVVLDRRAFSYYDVTGQQWTVAPGDFDIYVGRSSVQIELSGKTPFPLPVAAR